MRATPFGPLLLTLLACSSSTTPPASDGGTDAAADVPVLPGQVTLQGRIIDYTTKGPAPDAKVSVVGGASTTTDANGRYSLTALRNAPFTLTVSGDQKLELIEQEISLANDVERGDTNLVSVTTQNLLRAFLDGYDKTLAVVSVGLNKRSTCASSEGTTIELDPPQATAKVKYFENGLPSPVRGSAMDGELPTAIFYNLDPNVSPRFKIVSPSCKVLAYPVADETLKGLSYTGNVQIRSGDVASYFRAFLE